MGGSFDTIVIDGTPAAIAVIHGVVTEGNTVRQYVNGKLVNEGSDPFPKEGKILIQSEGAEVYFRNIRLYPLQ